MTAILIRARLVVLVHPGPPFVHLCVGRSPKVCAVQSSRTAPAIILSCRFQKNACILSAHDDCQLEFTGENDIDHTPNDETIRLYTGNAFDMTGERRRTEYRADFNARWLPCQDKLSKKNLTC